MDSDFPIEPTKIARTVAALFDAQGQQPIARLLRLARASVEETGYDNWNGGTYFYTLRLGLPVAEYAKVEPSLSDLEKEIGAKFGKALRGTGNQILNEVAITPTFEDAKAETLDPVAGDEADRLWDPGMLRLFLSHVSDHRIAVASLKHDLHRYGVSGFVAHEDIEPSLEWQNEIELALRSMDAMAALLTPEFHASNWTDQETGVAVGRGVLVVPIRLPINPYGLIAKHQGMRGDLTDPPGLASALVDILLRRARTRDAMRAGLATALEQSPNFAASKAVMAKIEVAVGWTPGELSRLQAANATNDQVSGAFGVPARLRRLAVASEPQG